MKSIPKAHISFNFYHLLLLWYLTEKQTQFKQLTVFLLVFFFQISFLSIFVLSSFLCFLFHLTTEAGTGPATLLKNRLWHRCLSVSFVKLLRAPFFTKHLRTIDSVTI